MSLPTSVQVKLNRAKEHLTELDHAIQDFLRSNPYVAQRASDNGPFWDPTIPSVNGGFLRVETRVRIRNLGTDRHTVSRQLEHGLLPK